MKKGISNFKILGWFCNFYQTSLTYNEKYFDNYNEFDYKRWLKP